MKNKLYLLLVLCTVSFSTYNFALSTKMEGSVVDIMLNGLESSASSDESGLHGRPLLQSVVDGGYKCANCVGDDCGAIC